MTGAEQFLVIVLSIFLTVSLLLSIIFLVIAIKVIRAVRRLTERAEHLANRAEAVGEFFTHAAGPIAIGRLLSTLVENVFKQGGARGRKRKD